MSKIKKIDQSFNWVCNHNWLEKTLWSKSHSAYRTAEKLQCLSRVRKWKKLLRPSAREPSVANKVFVGTDFKRSIDMNLSDPSGNISPRFILDSIEAAVVKYIGTK